MLFTLVYAYLSYFIHWRRRRRKMKYLRLIRSLSRHSSISTIQGVLGSSGNSGDIYRPVFQHVPNGDALELVRESEGKVLVSPKTVVDLRGWTLYMGISPNSTIQGQELFVLCEAVPNRRITLRQVPIMKVTDYGTPLAWSSGPPFKFILQCEPDDLVSLMLGMIDGQLMVEDNLEITSVTTVSVKGSAHRLIQTHGASLRSDIPHPTSSDTQGGRSLEGSNESLASVGRETDLEQELCRLSPSIDINIGAGEMNGLEIDGSPEVSAAGEAMAEFTETNIETNGFAAESDSHMVEEDDEEVGQDNRFSDKSKPPNVLIYCGKKDSARKFEGVRKIFKQCLHSERYVIYHLKHDQVHVTPWKEHCALLILASEKLYDGVDTAALDYFGSGGRILSFCSSLDQILLKRVKYQDSPMNVIQLDCGNKRNVTVISGRFCYELVDGKISTSDTVADAEVLGLAPEYDKPVIVRVRSKNEDSQSAGQVILSQVYLDKDPGEMGISTKIFSMLKQSNQDKFLILSSLLETLGMDCSRKSQPKLTAGVFLSTEQENVTTLMESLSGRIKTGIIRTPKKTLQFMGDFDDKYTVTEDMLPVFCNLDKSSLTLRYFRPQLFFQHLSTESLGQVVLYADVVPTTMTLLDGMMFSLTRDIGLVVIAGRQTSGRGRGGNEWISPPGCAMFSAHIRLDQASELGQKAAFLQHITAVAVVHCIRQLSGYQDVDLRVKWPNDIYYGKAMKLGGVIVSSTYMNGMIHAVVGCGFNVSNNNPTICINDVIQQHNTENGTSLEPFNTEELLGRVITTIEMLINEFQLNGQESFCSLYYKYWLHSGCRVSLESEGGQEVTIQGLDENGYLEVVTSEGTSLSLQPDGNTFDMLRNLIAIKHM